MEIKNYCYSGLVFRFVTRRPMLKKEQCEEFSVDSALVPDYTYEILPLESDMPNDWDQPVILRRDGDHIRCYMNEELLPEISVGFFLTRVGAAQLLLERGRFVLHASYIVHEGQAILFSAPSETGKSTQAHFWEANRGARIVNEDRVILSCEDGVWYAHGCWITGTAGVTHNVTVPVRCIVLLGQGAENRVSHPAAIEKLGRLINQCSFDDGSIEGRIKIVDLVSQMIGSVPVVAFDCRNHSSAVEELERWI